MGRRPTWPAAPTAALTVLLALGMTVVGVTACGPGLAPNGVPGRPTAVSALAYADGRAYLSWVPGAGGPPVTAVVQTVDGAGATVARTVVAGTDTTVSGLIPGRSYSFRVAAANQAGTGTAAVTNRVRAVGAVVPGVPVRPVLTAGRSDNQVTVSWGQPSGPPAPERYDVQVLEGTAAAQHPVGSFTCYAPCSGRTFAVDPGTVASVRVAAADPVGPSPAVTSNRVTVARPCPLACVAIDATAPGAAETHAASGFLHAVGPGTSPAAVQPLGARQWRVSAGYGSPSVSYEEEIAAGSVPGVNLTELLSDDWSAAHRQPASSANAGFAVPPWTVLAQYQAWVTAAVRTSEAVGRARGFTIGYWEVQNEPFAGNYYSAATDPTLPVALGGAGETVADFEAQYLAAYRGIKAADPKARVVAPSLASWVGEPAQAGAEAKPSIDMRTFLDFTVTHRAPPDAIAWHANDTLPLPDGFAANRGPAQPGDVDRAVDQLRRLVAERPSLGHPAILVNEYGSPTLSLLPGWDVGFLAALDAAGVAEANRSCYGTCSDGFLDGLLAGDGRTPLPGYWVYAAYAAARGRQVPLATTFTGVTGMATVTPSGQVSALLGRHQGCALTTMGPCPAAPVSVAVKVGFTGSADVTLAGIPAGAGPLPAPLAVPAIRLPVVRGTVSVTIPAMSDGDAVALVVAPGPAR
jgi:hypothetical protein